MYVTFEEAVYIADTIYSLDFDAIIESTIGTVSTLENNIGMACVLESDSATLLDAVKRYKNCPCRVDFKYVYEKHLSVRESEYKQAKRNLESTLGKLERDCDYNCVFGLPATLEPVGMPMEMKELFADYNKEASIEASKRLSLRWFIAKFRFMQSISPDSISQTVDRLGDIAQAVLDGLDGLGYGPERLRKYREERNK